MVTSISYPKRGAIGKTGSWREFKPILNIAKCVKCLRCWVFCPEGVVQRKPDDIVSINYEYCKGCGVCADVCKVKAITMKREAEEI